jgi:hypothetical protein
MTPPPQPYFFRAPFFVSKNEKEDERKQSQIEKREQRRRKETDGKDVENKKIKKTFREPREQ